MRSHRYALVKDWLWIALATVLISAYAIFIQNHADDMLGQWIEQQELNQRMAVVVETKEVFEVRQ